MPGVTEISEISSQIIWKFDQIHKKIAKNGKFGRDLSMPVGGEITEISEISNQNFKPCDYYG